MNQELANLLIQYYLKGIKQIKKMRNIRNIHQYLLDKELYVGVCRCAQEIFGKDIYKSFFVKSNTPDRDIYWFPTPQSSETKPEIIESLQKRIDVLKTYSE